MSDTANAKILLVEDEKDVRELMLLHLKREGLTVSVAEDGAKALNLLQKDGPFRLAVLDWMLPGFSGLEICKKIRAGGAGVAAQLPVLMVTARAEAADIVLGLEMGADDYITKPFEIPVFLARVRALLRRSQVTAASEDPQKFEIEKLYVDVPTHTVQVEGEDIKLTTSEFKILVAMLKHRGKVLSRERLISLVQGDGVAVVDRVIDTHVFGVRKKLGSAGDLIETIRGIGYRVKA